MLMDRKLYILAGITALISLSVTNFSPIDPIDFSLKSVPDISNNTDLLNAEHLLEGQLLAPEDIAVSSQGQIFLSLGDGTIVQYDKDTIKTSFFTRTGKDLPNCGDFNLEEECGRPLGMKFAPSTYYKSYLSKGNDDTEVLLVADAYKGLLLIESDGTVITLATQVNGTNFTFLNALTVAKDGTIYMTDSSTRFKRNVAIYEYLESRPSGALLAFHPRNQSVTVIHSELEFPNGIHLINDDSSILICLFTRSKIIQFDLQKEEMTDFVHLPGPPDNIVAQYIPKWNKEVYIVGISKKDSADAISFNNYPTIRRIIAFLFPMSFIASLLKPYGMVSILDTDGNILINLEDATGRTGYISTAYLIEDFLYMGSYKNNYLGRISFDSISLEE